MFPQELYPYIPLCLCYIYIPFLGNPLISLVMSALWNKIIFEPPSEKPVRNVWHVFLIGTTEQFLYFSSLIFGYPEIIGAWLVLKTVSSIEYWRINRTLFNLFLIGNALSLLLSGVTYKIFLLTELKKYSLSFYLAFIFIFFLISIFLISCLQKKFVIKIKKA